MVDDPGDRARRRPEVAGLIENLQRVDLTPVEEARGLKQLIACNGWTQSAAAVALGKSKADVSAVLRILSLPDSVLDAVLTSELEVPKNVLIELARIDDASLRDRLLELARQGELTVRAIREAEVRLKASIPANGSEPCTSRPDASVASRGSTVWPNGSESPYLGPRAERCRARPSDTAANGDREILGNG